MTQQSVRVMLWIGLAAALVAFGVLGFEFFGKNSSLAPAGPEEANDMETGDMGGHASETTTGTPAAPAPSSSPAAPADDESAGEVRAFTVHGDNFSFSPKEIRVKKGERVKIAFINSGGFHDWILDEFNAKTPKIQAGATAVVEFTADRAGEFQYYCSVGSHRQMGMWGTFIVE